VTSLSIIRPAELTVIRFLDGVQLIGIGVLGKYIGKIYMESKKRPRYIIESITKSVFDKMF